MEFLKANGIEDHSFVKEMDYQEVLNSQEIFGDELQMFAKKELQKEVSQIYPYSDQSYQLEIWCWLEFGQYFYLLHIAKPEPSLNLGWFLCVIFLYK